MSSALKKEATVVLDTKDSSIVETIIAAFSVGSFVVVWISSLLSPLLLYQSVLRKNYLATCIILLLSVLAYLPWKKGPISRAVALFFDTYHPKYYNTSKRIFAKGSLPSEAAPTFYAVHPHGAFCLGWSNLFASPTMSNVRFCFSPVLYMSPFFRLFSRLSGKPGTADKPSMVSYMKKGEHVALPPGGFEEATITCSSKDRVYIKKRAGFVKLCLQHGYDIVPIYCFGENQTYWNIQGAWKPRLALNGLGLPAILVWGMSWIPFLPKRVDLYIVAGKPLSCPKIESPTREDVSKWHDKYMAALTNLFEEYKVDAYGEEAGKTAKLELW